MPVIRFQTNVPVELRLRNLEGKPVESQFGGIQHMFMAEEGMFYVSETVGRILVEQFAKLGVKVGEPIDICKTETKAEKGRMSIQWIVSRDASEPAAPPSELEQQLAASIQMVQARKDAQKATQAAPADQPKWAQALATQTRHLVDVYAGLVKYASETHGNAVRAEDVKTLMTTVFINLSKQGANSNAA